jgi:23S rRNA (pseudouridine1915-N3)-methyltransferase
MKIKLLAVGKTDETYLSEGIEKYLKRLKHYIPFELIVIPDVKQGGKLLPEKIKEEEGKLIRNKLEVSDYVILLDENGSTLSSQEFSTFIQKKMNVVTSNLVFVIGGAFGFSPEIYKRANERISLSRMTFSHQMVRLFFVEQIYRAFTILKGEKYHHS